MTQILAAVGIGDPESERTVVAIVALLAVMGLALLMLALWLRRTTRPDPELLAPLEMMGERSWRRGDPVWQRRRLDQVRPEGAEPLAPAVAPPQLDEAFDAGPSAPGFDDLHDEPSADEVLSDADDRAADEAAAARRHAVTPLASERPLLDDLPDDEFDAEMLERANAELDAELHDSSRDR